MSNLKYEKFLDEAMPSPQEASAKAASKKPSSNTKYHQTAPDAKSGGLTGPNGYSNMDQVEVQIIPRKGYQQFADYLDDSQELPFKEKVRRLVENIVFRLFTIVLIVIDCTLLIWDVTTQKSNDDEKTFDYLSVAFASYFVLEVLTRMYVQSVADFFKKWHNFLDFAVIILSFIISIICLILDELDIIKLIMFARLIRVIVLVRVIRIFYTEPENIRIGARNVVSENKRRYRVGEFDLDLTYITDRVIGMSFPSSGCMALYRNNIRDVAKFFDYQHGANHYKVYNLCSERSYNSSYFHGSVARYTIDDHNVPTLEQMYEFAEDVKKFLDADPQNVVAVHCKGGKGRTGTMICVWLIYSEEYKDANEVLHYFAERRTDKTLSDKFQGVETPSQSRYVEYFTRTVRDYSRTIPGKVSRQLDAIRIHKISGVGNGDGSDLNCVIQINRAASFNMDFNTEFNCSLNYEIDIDILNITPINCPSLEGDVRIKFNSTNKKVPKAYENCAFYFWFNTAFLEPGAGSFKLDREELDNPHKSKTWNIYTEGFAVELTFRK